MPGVGERCYGLIPTLRAYRNRRIFGVQWLLWGVL